MSDIDAAELARQQRALIEEAYGPPQPHGARESTVIDLADINRQQADLITAEYGAEAFATTEPEDTCYRPASPEIPEAAGLIAVTATFEEYIVVLERTTPPVLRHDVEYVHNSAKVTRIDPDDLAAARRTITLAILNEPHHRFTSKELRPKARSLGIDTDWLTLHGLLTIWWSRSLVLAPHALVTRSYYALRYANPQLSITVREA